MGSRDASEVILRNDYRTRYINYFTRRNNTVNAIVNINGGSGGANEASEVIYVTIGSTLVPNEEMARILPPVIPIVVPTTTTIFYNPLITPRATVVTPDGIFMTDGSSLYSLPSGTVIPSPGASSLAVDSSGNLYAANSSNIYKYTSNAFVSMNITGLSNILTFVVSTAFYILQTGSSEVFMAQSNGAATVIAGSTPGFQDGSPGKLKNPQSLTLDDTGQLLYIADTGNSLIRTLSTSPPYTLSTVAGDIVQISQPFPTDNVGNRDGSGIYGETLLYSPQGITGKTTFYIADTANNNIRALTNGTLRTIAGETGTEPVYVFSPPGYTDGPLNLSRWRSPSSIFQYNSSLYITEPLNHAVRLLPL
jgi:hypothetical protein